MPEFNLADLFEIVVETVPDRTAVVAGPARRTYAELDSRANRFGNHLLSLGLPTGGHVGILAHNRAEWLEAMLGCFKARMVPINVNYRYVARELRYIVHNADLAALVVEPELTDVVEEAIAGSGTTGPGTTGPGTTGPGTTRPGTTGTGTTGSGTASAARGRDTTERSATGRVTTPGPVLIVLDDDYESALGRASAATPGQPRSPDDRYILYTGGTTGHPKGVVWRQEDIFFAAMGGGGWGSVPVAHPDELRDRLPKDDASSAVMLVTAPLMHGNAQWATFSAFFMGGTVVLYTGRSYDADAVLRLIGEERVASVALVGDAMARPLARALAAASPGTYDTSSLVAIGSGGAMLSAPVKAELADALPGVLILDRFGASESGAQGAVEHGALGPRFRMGPDTTVLDDDLRPLTPGDGRVGRLARSGRIPLGYHKDPVKTAATFPVDSEGRRWSVPGDLASIEADGTITVLGRGSGSINSGGEKIFPEEVEGAIKSHPDVFDAVVVGVPDERLGERVAAIVQLRKPGEDIQLEDLQAHCRQFVAGYKVPRELLVVERVPLTAAGKPDAAAARTLLESAADGRAR